MSNHLASVLITVSTEFEGNHLHIDDRAIAGTYLVQFNNELDPAQSSNADAIMEGALDIFHDRIAIKVLDDFEIKTVLLDVGQPIPQTAIEL